MAIVGVQRGQTTIADGASSATAAITAVTLANSWVNVLGVRTGGGGLDEWRRQMVDAELNSTTQITFRTATANNNNGITVEWEVVEDDEVTLQRGRITSYPNNPGTNNITITAVTLASTWVCSWAAADGGAPSDFFLPTWVLTTTTNLQYIIDNSGFGVSGSWQVIEDTGGRLSVQRLSGTLGTGTTVNVTISTIVLAESWIRFYAFRSGSGNQVDADHEVHGDLNTTTNLRFERTATAPSSWDYTAEVISSTEVSVQRGQFGFNATNTQNFTITAVVMAETFVMMSQSYTASVRSNTASRYDSEDLSTQELTSTTNVQTIRFRSTSNGVFNRWEVISAAEPPPPTPGLTRKIPVNPVLPVVQRNHPLSAGLVFSCCFGWTRGYRANEVDDLTPEDRTKRRGDIQGSTKTGIYKTNQAGHNLSGGDGDHGIDWENGPNNQLGDTNTPYGTLLMVFQPDVDDADNEAGVFTKRDSGSSTAAGWSLQTDNNDGTGYEVEVSQGSGDYDSSSGANAKLDSQHPQFLVGRWAIPTGGPTLADLWLDGILRGEDTTTSLAGNITNFNNLNIFSFDPVPQPGVLGQGSMGAVYKRLLPIGAIKQHHVDPYVLWRWPGHKQFFQGPGAVVGAQFQTYFHAF